MSRLYGAPELLSSLFGTHGVQGLANIEITSEFAVKLAAAYGATLKSGPVLVSQRLLASKPNVIQSNYISGLTSVGIEVQNLESMPIPISRYYVKVQRASGLVHVRVSQHICQIK